jgi:type II secretory pathway pseudopilin PulG
MSRTRTSEAGFTLAGLIVAITIIMLVIAYTVPQQWSKIMQRERDYQTIHAMRQYARAIYNFRAKNNSLPTSLQQIADARNPRFIRGSGELIDPLTGEVDWIPIPATAQQPVAQPSTGPPIGLPGGPGNPTGSTGAGRPQQQPQQLNPGQNFVGPIIGVRPNKKGPSFLALNGAESYEQWMFTVNDLQVEIDTRRNGLVTSSSATGVRR